MLVATAVVGILFLGSTLVSTRVAADIDTAAESITTDADPSIRSLSAARTELHEAAAVLDRALLDDAQRATVRDDLQRADDELRAHLDAYLALPFYPGERDHWAQVEEAVQDAERQMQEGVHRLEAGDRAGAIALRTGPGAGAIRRADQALAGLIASDLHQATTLGQSITRARHRARSWLFALTGVSAAIALALVGVVGSAVRSHLRGLDAQRRVEARERDAERALTRRLERVGQGSIRIADAVRRDAKYAALQAAADEARGLASADFAGIGVARGEAQPFDPWITSGLPSSAAEAPGEPPHQVGLLDAVVREGASVRVQDAKGDPRCTGLPARYPAVGPFLGVVVRHEDDLAAYLFLARDPGREPFTELDQRAVELLAAFAGSASKLATLTRSLRDEAAAREDLMAIVSHDLRNPLSAIALTLQQIPASLPADHPARLYTELGRRSVGRMERLIADLLTIARLREGRLVVEPALQPLAPIVADAIEGVAADAAQKHLRLSSTVPADLPAVSCDRDRIGQVLANLLGNAVKFTPDGGSIAVSVCAQDGAVRVSVRDTGPGIAREAIAHVFDRFWQEGRQARRGTGLGLYIAKGIVEAHHGTLSVESCLGQGSDFRFTLPVA